MAKLCNQCGESCASPHHYGPEESNAYGLIDQKVRGYYSSNALQDLTDYTFTLCEPCLKRMFDGFKISVTEEEYLIEGGRDLTEEERAEWRRKLNTPAHILVTKLLHAIIGIHPGYNDGSMKEPVAISTSLWKGIQDSDFLDVVNDGSDIVAEFYGIRLKVDPNLTGSSCCATGQVVNVLPVQTLLDFG